jgi:hypothetical protein
MKPFARIINNNKNIIASAQQKTQSKRPNLRFTAFSVAEAYRLQDNNKNGLTDKNRMK